MCAFQAALETVRCEELQLELAAAVRRRGGGAGGVSGATSSVAPSGPTVSWQPPRPPAPSTEIERIMAKIEQDNRILAELDHTRSTTHGKSTCKTINISSLRVPRFPQDMCARFISRSGRASARERKNEIRGGAPALHRVRIHKYQLNNSFDIVLKILEHWVDDGLDQSLT